MPPTTQLSGRIRTDDTSALLETLSLHLVNTPTGSRTAPVFETVLVRHALSLMWEQREDAGQHAPVRLDRGRLAAFFSELRATPERHTRYSQDPWYVEYTRMPELLRECAQNHHGRYCNGQSYAGVLTLHRPGIQCGLCDARPGTKRAPEAKHLRCDFALGGCGMTLPPGVDACENTSVCSMTRSQLEAAGADKAALEAALSEEDPVVRTVAALQRLTGRAAELTAVVVLTRAGLIQRPHVMGAAGDGGCDIDVRTAGADARRVTIQVKGGTTRPTREMITAHRASYLAHELPASIRREPWLVTFGESTSNTEMHAKGSHNPVTVIDGPELALMALKAGVTIPSDAQSAEAQFDALAGATRQGR